MEVPLEPDSVQQGGRCIGQPHQLCRRQMWQHLRPGERCFDICTAFEIRHDLVEHICNNFVELVLTPMPEEGVQCLKEAPSSLSSIVLSTRCLKACTFCAKVLAHLQAGTPAPLPLRKECVDFGKAAPRLRVRL